MVEEIFKRQIALPQGGSIVIEETEALVAIDVNSGRFKTSSAEETAFKINMQAAEEITRQIRLRDLGGLVVMDFIDMNDPKHIRKLEKRVRELMRSDRARYSLTRISQFGTMQMTRQRLRPSIQWRSSGTCPHCGGTGRIQNLETIALQALRRIKAEVLRTTGSSLRVLLHPQVADDFQNMMRTQLVDLESMYNRKIDVFSDPSVELGAVRIEQAK
jgi:ribonuclease E